MGGSQASGGGPRGPPPPINWGSREFGGTRGPPGGVGGDWGSPPPALSGRRLLQDGLDLPLGLLQLLRPIRALRHARVTAGSPSRPITSLHPAGSPGIPLSANHIPLLRCVTEGSPSWPITLLHPAGSPGIALVANQIPPSRGITRDPSQPITSLYYTVLLGDPPPGQSHPSIPLDHRGSLSQPIRSLYYTMLLRGSPSRPITSLHPMGSPNAPSQPITSLHYTVPLWDPPLGQSHRSVPRDHQGSLSQPIRSLHPPRVSTGPPSEPIRSLRPPPTPPPPRDPPPDQSDPSVAAGYGGISPSPTNHVSPSRWTAAGSPWRPIRALRPTHSAGEGGGGILLLTNQISPSRPCHRRAPPTPTPP